MLLRKKEEIENWLNNYNIKRYTLIDDETYGYVVNVDGMVNLWNKKLKSIDVKFNIIKGSFYCTGNNLTSLEGCPKVILFDFNFGKNKLKSLIGFPEINNNCSFLNNNDLDINSLLELPEHVKGYINLEKNPKLGNLQTIKKVEDLKNIINIIKDKNELNQLIENKVINLDSKKINKI